MFLLCLGAHVRVLTPINGCHFNVNCAYTSMIFVLVKVNFSIDLKKNCPCKTNIYAHINHLVRCLDIIYFFK
jgi:hypothetical protein